MIIVADEISGDIRRRMAEQHGVEDRGTPTFNAVYRVVIPRWLYQGDRRALELLDSNVGMRWMVLRGHRLAYAFNNNNIYIMVFPNPQRPNVEQMEPLTKRGEKTETLAF